MKRQQGQGAMGFVLMIVLIVIVAIAVSVLLGPIIKDLLANINNSSGTLVHTLDALGK